MIAPTVTELLSDPTVLKGLEEAWTDSQVDDAARRHEEGGWIYMDLMITVKPSVPQWSSDQALHVARLDAERAYGDLNGYRITVELESDGWHIDYDLKDPTPDGGGPHYVIDPATGAILSKRYEQ